MDEVTIGVITELLKQSAVGAARLGRAGAKRLKEETLVATGRAFKKYYDFSRKKYGWTKTILYRTSPVRLYDYYVHLKVKGPDEKEIDTHNTSSLLSASTHVIITGTAGSGKSTLMRHLFLNSLNIGAYLPIFVELRSLNDAPGSLLDLLQRQLEAQKLKLSMEALNDLLDGGKFLILLDAFDELDLSLVSQVERDIQRLCDQFGQNAIVVSSRPDERFVGWHSFTELPVLPLSKGQTLELVDRLKYDPAVKQPFRKAVDEVLFSSHRSFLENPLLLTLMLMTYEQFGDIPQKMHLFYAQAFDTLYSKHDATKSGYRREMASRLPSDDFQDVLSAFAILSYLDRQTVFSKSSVLDYLALARETTVRPIVFETEEYLTDLLKSLCILLQEGIQYVFAHRTFQEYFAARYIVRCAPETRTELLGQVQKNIRRDSVIRLAWQMDQRAVEDDFLIEPLSALRRATGFETLDHDDSMVRFLCIVFQEIRFIGGDVTIKPRDYSQHQLVSEVLSLYLGAAAHFLWPDSALTIGFARAVAARLPYPVLSDGLSIQFDEQLATPAGPNVPISYIMADPYLRKKFLKAFKRLSQAFEHSMKILDQIEESRDRRKLSIRSLLRRHADSDG
jgi:hypothetical protein